MTARKLQIALAASLLGNLFLAGALVGGAAWIKARQPMIAAGSLRIAGAELPLQQRKAFRAALRETRKSLRATTNDERAARIQAAALLRAPVLDQSALSAVLGRVRADDLAIRTAVEQRAIAFAATLPPQDRARLAERMEHPNGRGGRR